MSEHEKEIIKLAVEAGTQAGIMAWRQEHNNLRKGRHDRRLRNTKLLLKNYRMFNEHCTRAVYEASQIDEKPIDIIDLMWDPYDSSKISVDSIKKSAARTRIIMEHINEMLLIYKAMCDKSEKAEDKRRCRVLHAMYIADTLSTTEKIAIFESIDTRTVYKDIDIACEKMSALIFGIDYLAVKESC